MWLIAHEPDSGCSPPYTCVLWPSVQRDFLLSLASEHLYRPVWSWRLLEEVEYVELRKLIKRDASPENATRCAACLVDQMRAAFSDAEVVGWEGLEGTYGLPDPDDPHLVAAAVVGGAGAIVTDNVDDLPQDRMPNGIDVLPPAEFALNAVALDPASGLRALREIARRSGSNGRPVRTVDGLLVILENRYGMTGAVELIRQAADP